MKPTADQPANWTYTITTLAVAAVILASCLDGFKPG